MTLQQIKHKANAGDRRAQAILGNRYEIGFEVPESRKHALSWYRKSAEQGFAVSQFHLALLCKNEEEKAYWYREAAKSGVVDAQKALAKMLTNEDPQEAAHWFRVAAEAGDAEAQFELAELYEQGNGVPRNDEEAFRWFLSAEKLGWQASFEVARCYVLGQGIQKNSDEALKRLLPVANPKSTDNLWLMSRAQIWVATVFADTEHIKHNLVEAYVWLNLAAAYAPSGQEIYGVMSRESATECREILGARLSKEQLKSAQKRSTELFVPEKVIENRLRRS